MLDPSPDDPFAALAALHLPEAVTMAVAGRHPRDPEAMLYLAHQIAAAGLPPIAWSASMAANLVTAYAGPAPARTPSDQLVARIKAEVDAIGRPATPAPAPPPPEPELSEFQKLIARNMYGRPTAQFGNNGPVNLAKTYATAAATHDQHYSEMPAFEPSAMYSGGGIRNPNSPPVRDLAGTVTPPKAPQVQGANVVSAVVHAAEMNRAVNGGWGKGPAGII